MKKSILMISILLMLLACGGKKTTGEKADAAPDDSTAVKAKEAIVDRINALYAAAAKNEAGLDGKFACHTWRNMVAAVEKKDANVAEIGFFNEDYWTEMQDSNPDDLEARDIKFEQLDVEKGTALVDFVLHSSVQTVHRKFAFCREDGNWRVHDIIQFNDDSDGKETSSSLLDAMRSYVNEPLEENDGNELLFLPDLSNDKALDLSDGKDKMAKYFPVWDEGDAYQEDEEDGVVRYNLNLGYDRPLQQLFEELPGSPVNKQEVMRVILIDLNKDGNTDALVCLGRYGDEGNLYFDAYLWDEDNFGGLFSRVENFRNIPNPALDKETFNIIGHKGADREVWAWKGKNKIVKM